MTSSESEPQPNTAQSIHLSVMPDEIVQYACEIHPRVVVDGTFGGGGHSRLILQRFDDCRDNTPDVSWNSLSIVALDRDPAVSQRAESIPLDPRIDLYLGSYESTPIALDSAGFRDADAIILDLGLSSDQLADRDRGFSFNSDGELDLRFDPESGIPAHQWLMRHDEKAIADAIYQFGEERYSRRIAREIIARARSKRPVRTVSEMVDICRRCVPRSKNHDIHPATRTFQALRIAVNQELDILTRTMQQVADWLAPGGRILVLSFHSLEDRIVKNAFRQEDRLEVLTKKPLRPTDQEIQHNPRSRSAKLRVAQRRDAET
nr:16S rRNA (cytosine(1402)-N(4))-methyltransferase RsmH [Crateriforma conspicua]